MLKNELLQKLAAIPTAYNDYFAQLSSGAEATKPPEIPAYTPDALAAAAGEELNMKDKNVKDLNINETMQAVKVGSAFLLVNASPQIAAIGDTTGGYGSNI